LLSSSAPNPPNLLTFECLGFYRERTILLPGKHTWEELDPPDWRKDEEEGDAYDAIEAYFQFLHSEIS